MTWQDCLTTQSDWLWLSRLTGASKPATDRRQRLGRARGIKRYPYLALHRMHGLNGYSRPDRLCVACNMHSNARTATCTKMHGLRPATCNQCTDGGLQPAPECTDCGLHPATECASLQIAAERAECALQPTTRPALCSRTRSMHLKVQSNA
jgi:hypothetical protein